MTDQPINPFRDCIAIIFSQHSWGNVRKVRESEVEVRTTEKRTDVAKKRISITKKLLDSKEYQAIGSLDAKVRKSLDMLSVPSVIQVGAYLVTPKAYDKFMRRIEQYKQERDVLVDEFIKAYPSRVNEAKEDLDDLFNLNQYPPAEEVQKKFYIEVRPIAFEVPKRLEELDKAAYQAALEERRKEMQVAAQEIQAALRIGLKEYVDRMLEAVSGKGADGRRKNLRADFMDNFREFLDTFADRNATGDVDLMKQVDNLRKIVGGVDVNDLRDSQEARDYVLGRVKEVAATVDQLVEDSPIRKFSFDI